MISHEGEANSSSPDAIHFAGAPDWKLPDDAAGIVCAPQREKLSQSFEKITDRRDTFGPILLGRATGRFARDEAVLAVFQPMHAD